MGSSFFPPTLYEQGWVSAFEQVTTIHFNHRMFAYLVVVTLTIVAFMQFRKSPDSQVRAGAVIMVLAVLLQASLGVATVLSQVVTPVAAAHQSGAVLLLSATLFFAHARITERSRI